MERFLCVSLQAYVLMIGVSLYSLTKGINSLDSCAQLSAGSTKEIIGRHELLPLRCLASSRGVRVLSYHSRLSHVCASHLCLALIFQGHPRNSGTVGDSASPSEQSLQSGLIGSTHFFFSYLTLFSVKLIKYLSKFFPTFSSCTPAWEKMT